MSSRRFVLGPDTVADAGGRLFGVLTHIPGQKRSTMSDGSFRLQLPRALTSPDRGMLQGGWTAVRLGRYLRLVDLRITAVAE